MAIATDLSKIVMTEFDAWIANGKIGEFGLSLAAQIKMGGLSMFSAALCCWSLYVALWFGAREPKSPEQGRTNASKTVRSPKAPNAVDFALAC